MISHRRDLGQCKFERAASRRRDTWNMFYGHKITCKNLETSLAWTTKFSAYFLKNIWIFSETENKP